MGRLCLPRGVYLRCLLPVNMSRCRFLHLSHPASCPASIWQSAPCRRWPNSISAQTQQSIFTIYCDIKSFLETVGIDTGAFQHWDGIKMTKKKKSLSPFSLLAMAAVSFQFCCTLSVCLDEDVTPKWVISCYQNTLVTMRRCVHPVFIILICWFLTGRLKRSQLDRAVQLSSWRYVALSFQHCSRPSCQHPYNTEMFAGYLLSVFHQWEAAVRATCAQVGQVRSLSSGSQTDLRWKSGWWSAAWLTQIPVRLLTDGNVSNCTVSLILAVVYCSCKKLLYKSFGF